AFGTRREIKNLNSFKFMQQAIDFEIRWQIEELEDGRAIQQATVLFNPDTGETRAMRTKEDAADYRYFPDPDLPPLVIAREWVERVHREMTELPRVMAQRFMTDYGLSDYDAATLTQSREVAAYFEAAAQACGQPKLVGNWIMGEVSRRLNLAETDISACPITPAQLAQLVGRIQDGTISNNAARQVLDVLWSEPHSTVDAVIEAKGLKQMNDTGALEKMIDAVLAANPKNVAEFRAGNAKALNALVGQIMKGSQGKANPQQVNALLLQKLA
ncbi:MAG: Asp-tRNA(Asn)/Glu-tRNA(Gln) amidotransferase GatCAB subunit B, partial [Rhodoferax sp.]|nr:Asp-tRNA(Asn)/Glu-tRNA(Gln) amidotransferase GatCAB subunit B [Rhodoferax sp.]MDP3863622.1 Asp-tRNA(Asn)/Glu-tRNA(Gln) amidotransferase GatCAB subunit B [Rhodoferax sp.]